MTYEAVVSRIHHEPDEITTKEEGKLCVWSAFHHSGPLEKLLLGYPQPNGHYYLYVVFNDQDKVVRVELTEA